MPTSFSPRGDAITLLRKAEATFGVAPTGNWIPVNVYDYGIVEKQPLVADPLLGQARQNNRDPLAPAPGLAATAGDITIPLDLGQLGYWLTDVFGAPTTSGTTPNYTHVWTSGLEVLPSVAFEAKLNTTNFKQHLGNGAAKFAFDIGNAQGYDKAVVSYLGRIENPLTATAGGTPSAIIDRIPLVKATGVVKIDGTAVGSLISAKGSYDNGLKPQLFAGDPRPVGFDLDGIPAAGGSLSFRYRDETILAMSVPISPAVVPAVHTLEKLWTIPSLASTRSFSILHNAVRLQRGGIPIKGPEGLLLDLDYIAEQTASLPMLTVTLKTSTASF